MERYYHREHLDGYARLRATGGQQWSDLHEQRDGFADFPNRTFLATVLPPVDPADGVSVLEYGCGTGPAACFLAQRGYRVQGVDLVPDAIELARSNAAGLGLAIDFAVEDICRWHRSTETFDIVLDSYCLQSIVLDEDRARVLDGVRQRLADGGRFVLSTAVFIPDRDYGDGHYDVATGIEWAPGAPGADAVRISGAWYSPHRRHLTAEALRSELESHGFTIDHQSDDGGDLVCSAPPGRR